MATSTGIAAAARQALHHFRGHHKISPILQAQGEKLDPIADPPAWIPFIEERGVSTSARRNGYSGLFGRQRRRASIESPIDWESVAEWDNQDRYKPIGSIDAVTARRRIEQTDLLFKEFVHHEIVESLERSEAALAAEGIVFNLFAWVRWPGNQWKLNVATEWLDANT